MFIRKKRNKGGSVSILLVTGERIAGKKHVTSKIIKHFGAADTPEKLELLVQAATEYKIQLQAQAPKKIKPLKINAALDLASCKTYRLGFSDIYGPLFHQLLPNLPLKEPWKEHLNSLVTMRIAAPNSKRQTALVGNEYGISLDVNRIYRLMDKLTPSVIEAIKKSVYQNTKQLLNQKNQPISVLFYDLTTVYFETGSKDSLRNVGFSKDGKHQHVQIMLAVIVTHEGLPIDYEEFEGNCFEGHTLLPVIEKLQQRYDINNTVLVADAALMNKINLSALSEKGIHYIIAARLKKASSEVKKQITAFEHYKKMTSTEEDELHSRMLSLGSGDSLVVYHSALRARKDYFDRQKELEKIRGFLSSTGKRKLSNHLKKSYVSLKKDCVIDIDIDKLEIEGQMDGFFGFQTNISNPNPSEVLSLYRGLWQVEQTFRIAKSQLNIRPVFHYTERRIRAHFAVCYLALALLRTATFILKQHHVYLPVEQLHTLIEKMCIIRLKDQAGQIFDIRQDHPPDLREIYRIFQIPWPKKFVHRTDLL